MNAWRDRIASAAGLVLQVSAALVALYVAVVLVAVVLTLRDEWRLPTWRVRVQLQGHELAVPAATALRMATSPLGGRALDGRTLRTECGDVRLAWDATTRTLTATCAPCALASPALGARPIPVPVVVATVRREGSHLAGTVRASAAVARGETLVGDGGAVAAGWHAALGRDALVAHFTLPPTPLADVYRVLASEVPEAARARIDGTFAVQGTVHWPAGAVELEPRLDVRAVAGLGTERLREGTIPGCGAARAVGDGRAWRGLREAVIAAEDQRFRTHGGYDPVELEASLAANLAGARVERGASTLTQQLARVVYTGGERDVPRKLRELLYAVEMERTLGKDRILDAYLAVAPWASGGCGAEAAARAAFGKPLRRLSTAQIARLAGGLRSAADLNDLHRAVRVVRSARGLPPAERAAALHDLCAVRAHDGCPAVERGTAVRLAGAEPTQARPHVAQLDLAWIPVDADGATDDVRPDSMAAADVASLDSRQVRDAGTP